MGSVHDFRPPNVTAPMPHSIEAEQALLGVLMSDAEAISRVAGLIGAQHFFEPLHGRIFAIAEQQTAAGMMGDAVVVAQKLADDPAFQDLGGFRYLGQLIANAPPSENAADYARLIFDSAVRRDIARVCAEGLQAAASPEAEAFDVASAVRRGLEALEDAAAPDDISLVAAPVVARKAVESMREMAAHGRPRGCMTGLRCFDRRANGLKPGALVIIGARPAMGKTGVARAAAHGAAVRNPNHSFLFLNLEMDGVEIMQRELSALTHAHADGVEYRTMESGSLTPLDFMNIAVAEDHVPTNLILDERCGNLGVDDVRRKLWALGRRGPVGAVFIDYLQLMRRPPANGRNEASVIGEMTRALKQLAREAKVCIVLLSQLSRLVEQRDDKKPQLSDLRESGAIEQDADLVLFPFREYYYLQKAEPKTHDQNKRLEWEMRCEEVRRRMEVICAKQRGGPEGTDRQRYLAEFDVIEDEPQ